METYSRLEQANDNAAEFWLAQARVHAWQHLDRPGFTAVRCGRTTTDAHRVVVTRPYEEPVGLEEELEQLLRTWDTTRLCLEDPYGRLDLSRFGCVHGLGMAVMTREPASVPSGVAGVRGAVAPDRADDCGGTRGVRGVSDVQGASGLGGTEAGSASGWGGRRRYGSELTVDEARDGEGLAAVERTVVEAFPVPEHQPLTRGRMLPEGLLGEPGIRAWRARVEGQDAGACLTYDNGETVGVYWVATLPAHRSQGVARALLMTALAAHPDRPATLVATLLAEPLYRKLGFVEHGVTRWWGYPAAPEA
ncbi:GNAT family N-acetyltransferase [Kitasatospora sp. NBC_00240]|uniref:GNAT family N-acetyltransferase n=1 Tax=Kitasatospora sp. NBC_00240 TaxID=2903567 RepID=UPI00224F621A|nr:GNAT family N-acetyltransferase [Kitasatospora sp. NBC_00240]MCX5212797.1 GNAT family N-acetyltransferase [Kitasatospora sp. NBC_00240]